MNVVFSLLRRAKPTREASTASVPRGIRVYAVGDIHGCGDLVDRLTGTIVEDAARTPGFQDYLVFLGDYVDRGLGSRQVVDRMLASPPPGFGVIHLRGNHEQAMLDFLADAEAGFHWLRFGGEETLHSYGITIPVDRPMPERLAYCREALQDILPAAHRSFLQHLRHSVTIGDYFFTHAGVRPSIPLDQQNPDDLLWIRNEFLDSDADFGKVVVHGHTISEAPIIRHNRIGIDTGAYATGRLTCLVLEGEHRRFLHT